MFQQRRSHHGLRIPTLILGVIVIVGACGGTPTSVAPSAAAPSVALASPTAAPTPTPAPTPSPTPADVSAAFVRIISSPDFSGKATLTGTVTSGTLEGTISGEFAGGPGNSSTTTTVQLAGVQLVSESIKIGDKRWSRKSPGPWLDDPETAASKASSLADYLRSVSGVVDLGVETRTGRQLHHLQAKSGNQVSGALFGLDAATAKDPQFTVDFYATDDGTPAAIAMTAAWTQVNGATSVPTNMTFEFAFSDIGTPPTITRPDDVWVRYASKAHGYTMAHPADWTVKAEADEDAYLLNGQGYVYVALTKFKGTTDAFAKALKASYKKSFKGPPKSETATRLGGEPATRLLYEFTNAGGQDVTVADDVVSRAGTGWEVFVATAGGMDDVAVFDQFVSTFEFAK